MQRKNSQEKRWLRSRLSMKKSDPQVSLVSEEKKVATITIQKHIRTYLAKKKYRVPHLSQHDMASYPAFVVGNDPIINGHEAYRMGNEKVALIATSGMRAVLLACDLGSFKKTPKILLVDNSIQVCEFWLAMRDFMQDENRAGTCEEFTRNIKTFLSSNHLLYRDIPDLALVSENTFEIHYPNQNIVKFFTDMFYKHGYENVRAVIKHASIIKQGWESEETFEVLRNILDFHEIEKVFAYPSNIIGCTQDKNKELVILQNIAKLRPVMTLHTEGVKSGSAIYAGKPHCLESCDPEFVCKELKVDENRFRESSGEQELLAILSFFGGSRTIAIRIQLVSSHCSDKDEDACSHGSYSGISFF